MSRTHKLAWVASGIASIWLTANWAAGNDSAKVAAHLEKIAADLPWLAVDNVIYDRDPRPGWGPDTDKVTTILARLVKLEADPSTAPATAPATAPRRVRPPTSAPLRTRARDERPFWYPRLSATLANPDNVRPLLKHADPRVRTLAIALLLKLERLDVMADIAELVDDKAETFPAPGMISSVALAPPPDPWPMEKQTVGDFARPATERYVRVSAYLDDLRRGNRLPRDGPSLAQVFKDMAATRDPFTNTATLRVAAERATGRTSPIPDDRRERVRGIWMTIAELPPTRRFFVAHALDLHNVRDERYSPTFALDMARQVPHDVRIAAIRGEPFADDPDLPRGAGAQYFLANAVQLLRASDVELLLRLDREQFPGSATSRPTGYATASYLIAAARLAPTRADEFLIPALHEARAKGSSWENADAAAAVLAELGSESGVRHALNWFFSIRPEPSTYGGGREAILGQLELASPQRYRAFVARVIRDDRLTTLGPASTRQLVRAVQGYSGLPIADEEEIRSSYGINEAQRDRKLPSLADWHRRLRESTGQWDEVR